MKPTVLAALLVLLVLPMADAVGKTAGKPHTHKVPTAHVIVKIEITSADVSTDLVSSVNNAMGDPFNQKSRLQTLSQEATAKGQTCVITRHTRVFDNPRVLFGSSPRDITKHSSQSVAHAPWSLPVSDSLYTYPGKTKGPATVRRRLSVDLTPILNANKTMTVHFYVWKRQAAVIPQGSPLKAHVSVWGQDHLLNFHNGETKGIAIHYPGDDVQHLVFATVTLLPPTQE